MTLTFNPVEIAVDPALQAAIEEHRSQLKKPVHEPGRTSTFFMFNTIRLDGQYREMRDGPRIGFDAETVARLLVLFDVWKVADKALRWSSLVSSTRLVPLGIYTDEQVYDETSQRIYAARIEIQFEGGIYVPKRNPESGGQMPRSGAHEIRRGSIESWRNVEQVTIERGLACTPTEQTL